MSPNPAGSTTLPPKEANLFKAVVRLYETKQLKKALKSADAILKRFPHHGETLAMKGLTLNALDKKPEANDLVRRGLRMDMRSHICWHVYGLLYRSDRDYRAAAKAYLNALKFDKDNQQILRDLALLQIQIRDYEGLEDTRRTLLTVKPSQRHNWIGFALSFHLLNNYAMAVSVLDTYRETLKQSNDPEDRYEASELLLYKAFILEESGDHAAALQHIEDCGPKLVDRLAVRETKARILAALGRFDEAADELTALLRINPDNRIYQKGLQCLRVCSAHHRDPKEPNGILSLERPFAEVPSHFVDPDLDYGLRKLAIIEKHTIGDLPPISGEKNTSIALGVCNQLSKQFPKSRTAQRIALDILPSGEHPEFPPRIDAYVRKFLRKGVSSLFSDMRPLYSDLTKASALGKLFESFRLSLESDVDGALPAPLAMPDGADGVYDDVKAQNGGENQGAPVLLWVLHFLAQHYDCLRQYDRALSTIEKAIEIDPATVECYLVKAKILKHCGDLKEAVSVADEARKLDLSDRYLNTKCSDYALQADMVTKSEAWVALFTRDVDSGGVQALYDMQCMWFELGAAESYLRRGQLSQALKHFTAVDRHFADMVEDQFDFHSYCIRKVTLRAYVRLLRFEDHIRNHPYYSRAATGIVQCLLRLFDLPEHERNLLTGEHADIAGFAEMTDAQRKKAISKRKKQLARQRQAQHGTSSSKGSGKHISHGGKPTTNGVAKNQGPGKEASGKGSGGGNENKAKTNPGWMELDPSGTDHVRALLNKSGSSDRILEDATKVVRELQRNLGDRLQTQVLSFELAIRKKKYLQALRAVKRAQRLYPEDPKTMQISVKLAHEVAKNNMRELFSETVKSVYDSEGDILAGKTPKEFIDNYVQRNKHCAERRVGGARCKLWLAQNGAQESGALEDICKSIVQAIDDADVDGPLMNFLSADYLRELLIDLRNSGIGATLFKLVTESCCAKYPRSSCF